MAVHVVLVSKLLVATHKPGTGWNAEEQLKLSNSRVTLTSVNLSLLTMVVKKDTQYGIKIYNNISFIIMWLFENAMHYHVTIPRRSFQGLIT